MLNQSAYDKLGCPVVEHVNMFSGDDVNVSLRPIASNNFMVLEIPNIWQQNNKTYNYRKLKSYKIQTVYDEQYSEFSVPTYQSLIPVSIEKMIILEKEDTEDIPTLENKDESVKVREIIRKDGLFYKAYQRKRRKGQRFPLFSHDGKHECEVHKNSAGRTNGRQFYYN